MKSQFSDYVVLPGSYKKLPTGIQAKAIGKDALLNVSIRLQPKTPLPDLLSSAEKDFQPMEREAFYEKYGANPEDVKLVTHFAHANGLSVVHADARTRIVQLRGTHEQMEKAFQVSLHHYEQHGKRFHGRGGEIYLPQELIGIVTGVFGLDDRDVASPKFKVLPRAASPASFNPNTLADIYNYPAATGKQQSIAIIELGGGYKPADITNYFKGLGINTPKVVAVSVDSAHNAPTTADSADGEVLLDIEVAGAIAPDATIVVYFTPNTDKGFLDAITQAIHDNTYTPSVISISWGSAESNWTQQSLQNFNQAFQEAATLGVTICVATGDTGSNDGEDDGNAHADFPASSPYALACGGTKLLVANGKITSEVTWHESDDSATGGGISEVFPVPDYQAGANIPVSVNDQKPGRGIPDVSAVADPETGYNVLVDGQKFVIGGTSAVAPLMAGLIARINEKLNKKVGFIHPKLYAQPTACRDITDGDNITVKGKGYSAGPGWDACTGIGVPDGEALLKILS